MKARDWIGLAALAVAAVAATLPVPEWPWRHLLDPSYAALVAFEATAIGIFVLRAGGRHRSTVERVMLALFLAGMPLIYLADLLRSDVRGTWTGIELGGLALFAALAWFGLRRSAWFLAAGIATHGLAWDLWHRDLVTFVPSWYATGCLVADLGLGLYVATQAREWDRGRTSIAIDSQIARVK